MRTRLLHLKNELVSRKEMASMGSTVLLAFLISNAQTLSAFSPWGIAFCMAVPYRFTVFAFAGSLIGYLVSGSLISGGIYIAALLIAVVVKIVVQPKDKYFVLQSGFAFGSLLLLYVVSMIISPVGVGTWIFNLSEAIVCGGVTYLFGVGIAALREKKDRFRLQVLEKAGIAMLFVILLMSFAGISIFQINIARVIGVGCIMAAAVYIGSAGAASVGVFVTLALALYNPAWAVSAGMLIVAGFITGAFRPIGKLPQIIIFLALNLFAGAFMGVDVITPFNLIEVAIGMGIFLLLPRRWFDYLLAKGVTVEPMEGAQKLTSELSSKLNFTASTLMDLQSAVEEVSTRLDKISEGNISSVYTQTADQVCKKCPLNTFCWITAYSEMMNALNSCTKQLREQGKLVSDKAPYFFQQKCARYDEFSQAVNQNYKDYITREQSARRINEARMVAIEQFSGISDMLVEMSQELSEVAGVDMLAATKVSGVLQDRGIVTNEICCMMDRFSRMTIDIFLDRAIPQRTLADLAGDLSDELGREFELPSVIKTENKTRVSFFERAVYSIEFAAAQDANQNNAHCGDSYDQFMDGKGFAHVILSDGMGTGSHAAVDSAMTCATLRQLIQSGFGFESAFKLMNLSFFVKSRDESLSTVDVCDLDLYTGRATFSKAGAASSFILRGNRVTEVESDSLPIGILQGIRYDSSQMQLTKGDILVMVSDGMLMGGKDWIIADLELLHKRSAQEIATNLLKHAQKRWLDGHSDDVTVLVTKMK